MIHNKVVGLSFALEVKSWKELKHTGDDRCWWVAHAGLVAAGSTHSGFKMQGK